MFYPNLWRFVWIRHAAGAHLDELQYDGRKPTETSVTEFCHKREFILRETHKH